MGSQSSKSGYQTMSRKEQPPCYSDVVVNIDKPGISTEKPPLARDLESSMELKPLDIIEFLASKQTFDICRKEEYERAYKEACELYIRLINSEIRISFKKTYLFVTININHGCNPSIKISNEYRNYELDTQIINKVYEYIVNAYKDYKIERTNVSSYQICMRIYLPNNTMPFETTPDN